MKTLRIIFLSFSALFFLGSVAAVADGIKKNNMDQVSKATPMVFLSMAAPAVANYSVRRMVVGFMGGGGLTREEQTLLAFLEGGVDPTTAKAYREGKARFVDANYYIRKEITGSNGKLQILDERTQKATGVTNIHLGKLQKGENAVISQVLVGYATDAAKVNVADLVYDSVVTSWPTGLANAELQILQDGAPCCDPIPVALCGTQADSTAARGMVDSKSFRTPFILEEEKQIVITVDFPVASFGANKHHIEVFLLGSKSRVRTGK